MESDNLFYWNEGVDINQLCRICANSDENLIPIFEGEGVEQELKLKIDKHLPIKVSWDDLLPANICYGCASTLAAWDSLTEECVLAEQKLRQLVLCLKEEVMEEYQKSPGQNDLDEEEEEEEEEEEGQPSSDNETQVDPVYAVEQDQYAEEPPAEGTDHIYSSGQTMEQDDPEVDQQSDSEFPAEYLYSPEDSSIKEEVVEQEPSVEQLQETEPTYSEVEVQEEGLVSQSDHEYTTSIDQRRLNKKRPGEPKVVFVKCSKQSKLTLEEQVARALNYLQSHDVGNEQNYGNKKFLPSQIVTKKLINATQESQFLALQKNANSDIQSEFLGGEITISTENDEQDKSDLINENVIETGSAVTLNTNDQAEKVSPEYLEIECRTENVNSEIEIPTEDSVPTSSSSVLNWPSHFLTQADGNLNSNCNLIFFVPPISSDNTEEQSGTLMSITNSSDAGIKIERSDSNNVEEMKSTHLLLMPVNSSVKYKSENINDQKKIEVTQRAKITHYKCDVCNIKYFTKANLMSHRMSSIKELKCCKCAEIMANTDDLVEHVKIHSSYRKTRKGNSDPLVCQVCGKLLQNNMCLNRHMMLHTGNRPYACDMCDKTFCTKLSRDDHRHIHTGEKPYVCDMCGKNFSYRSHLSLHRNSHLEERPYECALCKKRFNRRQYLILHIRTHTGEKPYACNICNRAFAQRNDMNKHKLTHSWERTFVCECGMSFKQKRDLQKHKKSHKFEIEGSNIETDQIIYIEEVQDHNTLQLA